MEARQLVIRELEGLEFQAIVLRVRGDEADIVYLDDQQIESDVPLDELTRADTAAMTDGDAMVGFLKIWREALKTLSTNISAEKGPSSPTRAGSGRYVADDGTQIISHHEALNGKESRKMGACGGGLRGIRALREVTAEGLIASQEDGRPRFW